MDPTLLSYVMLSLPLWDQGLPVLAATTSITSIAGDYLGWGGFWAVADVINAVMVALVGIYRTHTYCHWLSWMPVVIALQAWAVGVFARRFNLHTHAKVAHLLWHILGFLAMSSTAFQMKFYPKDAEQELL